MNHLVRIAKSLINFSVDVTKTMTNSIVRESPSVVSAIVALRAEILKAVQEENLAEVMMEAEKAAVEYQRVTQKLVGDVKLAIRAGARRAHIAEA
jgi:hypothetical protein